MNSIVQKLIMRLDDEETAVDACDDAIHILNQQDEEIKRLRDALGVIARNVDADAVHFSWCSKYAKEVLAITVLNA